MKKYLPLVVAGVVILVITGGVYLFSNKSKSDSMAGESITQDSESSNDGGEFVGSLADALKVGGAMKCSWNDDMGNSGTAFVDKSRVYYESSVEGQDGYMISKDNCVWSWNKGESQGMTICTEPDETEGDSNDYEIPDAGQVDTGNYEFKCSPTVVNENTFSPPTEVEFMNPMDLIPSNLDVSY